MAALVSGYDGLLLDLDGTVYRGEKALPSAVDAIAKAQVDNPKLSVLYVTNNASRSASEVAAHLASLGFSAPVDRVVTSAHSAARLLASKLERHTKVLVVGSNSLADEVAHVGLVPVRSADARPKAVIQGHSPRTDWALLAEAAVALRAGALWVASNLDATLPTERGLLPGNGAMVAALRTATGKVPLVAGKPERPLFDDAIERGALVRPLAVGDGLDTDIAGANTAQIDSLMVLTGVSGVLDLVNASPAERPTFLAADLRALTAPPSSLRLAPQPGWSTRCEDGVLRIECSDSAADPLQGARAAVAAAWLAGGASAIHADGAGAVAALEQWCRDRGVGYRHLSEVSASVVLDE